MYNSVLIVIQSGEYNLSDLTKKIDTLWLKSYLTDDDGRVLLNLLLKRLTLTPDFHRFRSEWLHLKSVYQSSREI